MKYSVKSSHKQDLQRSDVRPFDAAYLELVKFNPGDEIHSNKAYATQAYPIVIDSDGKVICPDKL